LTFTTKPSSKNFELGASGKIHCKASRNAKVFWLKDSEQILPDSITDMNGTLYFNNIELSHKGVYTCVAMNDRNHNITISIDVGIVPQFKIKPKEYVEVVELQSILLDCEAIGDPAPTVRWDFETKMIDSHSDDRFHVFENGSLLLREVLEADNGRYGCTIGNSAGFKRSECLVQVKRKFR
jgi:PTK7 protein tyrosine kinase 7